MVELLRKNWCVWMHANIWQAKNLWKKSIVNSGFATVMVVLSFPFLIISAESLKNHNKS